MKTINIKLIRKYIAFIIAFAMLFSFCSCGTKEESPAADADKKTENSAAEPKEKTVIRLGGLTGPTTMGIVKLLNDSDEDKALNKYEYQIAGSADELTPLLVKGELDVLIGPANLAAVLNSKTNGNIQMLAIDVLGVLSIMAKGIEITSVSDLKGQTIYATGKGSTPEYTLTYILSQNGLKVGEDVMLEFKSEPAEILALAKTSDTIVAMLPQPYATAAQASVEGFSPVLVLSDEWDRLGQSSRMVTACIMARKDFAEANPDAIDMLLQECSSSVEWVNSNTSDAAVLIEKYIGIKQAVAQKVIPKCNLVCITGEEMKAAAEGFFEVLYSLNPSSVGGSMPEDSFFYSASK